MIRETSIKKLLAHGMKFPLFDIDGTLLEGINKSHLDSFDYALRTIYKQPAASVSELSFHGMIDTQILIEILKIHGISEKEAKGKMDEAIQAMVYYFENHKENGKFILLSGVKHILKELQARQVPIGLLTGNIEQIGWEKMKLAEIRDYFTFGAFGNLAFKRVDLIKVAQERLQQMTSTEIPLKHFAIIGDTPLDIACAKAGGIEVIAVASGIFSVDELEKFGADLVIQSLHEKNKILEFLNIK